MKIDIRRLDGTMPDTHSAYDDWLSERMTYYAEYASMRNHDDRIAEMSDIEYYAERWETLRWEFGE